MAIQYRIRVEGETLLVRAWGFDDDARDVQEYGLAVIEACMEHGVTRVLCDESELEYRLDAVSTYEAGQLIAARAARVVKVAIVCNPRHLPDAQFWEDVVVNRGLRARVFDDPAKARVWLDE